MHEERNRRYPGLVKRGDSYSFKLDGKRVTVPKQVYQGLVGEKAWKAAYDWKLRESGQIKLRSQTRVRYLEYATSVIETRHQRLKPSTRRLYMKRLRSQWVSPLHRLWVHEITTEHIRQLVLQPMLAAGLAGNTVNSHLANIQTVLSFAWKTDRMFPNNPVSGLAAQERPEKKKGKIRIYTRAEMDRLFAEVAPQYRIVFALAYYTGARISEILGLRWRNILWETSQIFYEGMLDPELGTWVPGLKTDRHTQPVGRSVEMGEETPHFLKEQLAFVGIMRRPDEPVCGDVTYGGLTAYLNGRPGGQKPYPGFRDRLGEPFIASGGYEPLSMHKLRHNYGSRMISAGADIAWVADQMGDTIETVRSTYEHEVTERTRNPEWVAEMHRKAFG